MHLLLYLIGLSDWASADEAAGADVSRNPTQRFSALKHEEVEDHRSLSCAEYDACLDLVLERGWPGWTCSRCELFPKQRKARVIEITHEHSLRPLA